MYHYSLTRSLDDVEGFSTTVTVSDRDPINCAHMLVAVFNTINRNVMNGWLLGSVNTAGEGSVEFDGKIHRFAKPDPWSVSQSFTFEPSAGDADTVVRFFGEGGGRLVYPGKFKFTENTKAAETLAKSAAGHVARSVLEEAYAELQAVKEVLFDAGVETIPADAGVRDLLAVKRSMSEQIAEITHEHAQANAAARSELVEHVRGAYLKKERLTADDVRPDLEDRFRGMLDILAKFLVAIGEADADEGHAVARRLCGFDDE